MSRINAVLFSCAIAFYGTTALAQSSGYSVVYNFLGGNDGANPAATLIDVGGTLYGTTQEGGPTYGVVFSLNPTTDVEQVVFPLADTIGTNPQASLLEYKGTLYGTASEGGNYNGKCRGCGTVFSVNPANGTGQIVYAFSTIAHGTFPQGGLINVGNLLYGTTPHGGSIQGDCARAKHKTAGCGTLFSINPKTGAEKVLHTFLAGNDGAYPTASLINIGGTLYGTTQQGGGGSNCDPTGCGTIFSLDPATGVEKVVYSFPHTGGNGAIPSASLISVSGTLFGTTVGGGLSCACGTVFSFNPTTGVETVVYAFRGGDTDGSSPLVSLSTFGDKLYGVTFKGGVSGNGALFSVDPATGQEKVLHFFQGGSDGAYPTGGLVKVGGTLYGTTNEGGSGTCYQEMGTGCGIIFSYTP